MATTTGEVLQLETAGFGDSLDERIFYGGPSNSGEAGRLARRKAREAAARLLRTFVAGGLESEAHCERVAAWSRRLARELGLPPDRVLDIELGALVHDVGYIGLPDLDLHKKEPLTPFEVFELRRHPQIGVGILRHIPVLCRAIPLVESHHERFDGTGYPHSKGGSAIPIDGRIFRLVDTYESLTTGSHVLPRMSDAEARTELGARVGAQLDPAVYAAFSRIDPAEWLDVAIWLDVG
jgi:HD-GYP domain-containing protein (c-di-GMP phosphodiesterase class II)